jgi:serine/threonine protein kinase
LRADADLKGGNVLLSGEAGALDSLVAKVADFGLARDFSAATRIQTAKYGTITHMPPELLTEGMLTKVSSFRQD